MLLAPENIGPTSLIECNAVKGGRNKNFTISSDNVLQITGQIGCEEFPQHVVVSQHITQLISLFFSLHPHKIEIPWTSTFKTGKNIHKGNKLSCNYYYHDKN